MLAKTRSILTNPNRSTLSPECGWVGSGLVLGLVLMTGLANAQTSSPPGPTELPTVAGSPPAIASSERGSIDSEELNELNGLLDDLKATGTRISELRKDLRAAPAANRILLLPEVVEVRTRYRRELVKASSSLLKKRAASLPVPLRKAAVGDVARRLRVEGKSIENELVRELQQLITLIALANKATEEERTAADAARNASAERAPFLLGELAASLEARDALGQDAQPSHGRLRKWLLKSSSLTGATLHSISEGVRLLQAPNGESPNAQSESRLSALLGFRDLAVSFQRKNLALMDAYGMKTTQYRQELISSTGEVSEDILDVDVLAGLLGQLKDKGIKWLSEKASVLAFKLVSFLLVVSLFVGLAKIGRWLARRAVARASNISGLAGEFFVKTTGRVIVTTGLIIAAGQAGFQVGPVLAGLGIAGFVLGFALQDTLSNFASGMMILMYRPFDLGDVIEAAGAYGTVKAMTLVSTSILTFDNQMLLVPNNKIWGGVVRNVTHQPTRRVDLSFGIAYSDDIDHAERVLRSIVADNQQVLEAPAAVVRLHELADSSVNFVVRPWVKTADYWSVYWSITREVKRRFDAEGLSFPFPQRDVHVYEERRLESHRRDSDVAPIMSSPAALFPKP